MNISSREPILSPRDPPRVPIGLMAAAVAVAAIVGALFTR
jgi:hypothetical protein